MAKQFNIKQYDLYPVLRMVITDTAEDGTVTPVDLTLASEVRLLLKNRTQGLKVNAVMSKLDQSNPSTLGQVEYAWQSGDTDNLGTYQGEIQILWPGLIPQTFPAKGYFKVNINRDLNLGPVS